MAGRPIPIDAETLLREQAWVYSLARSLVSDASTAEDVVQETWLAALTHLSAGRERPQIRAFLATVVRRVSLAWRRTEAQRRWRERRASRDEAVPESDALEWLALQHRLADAITELREPYRTAIVMRYVEGLAPNEIARRLAQTPEAVRTRLSRGLDLLRTRLDRESGGERRAWHAVLGGLVVRRGARNSALASTLAGAISAGALMGWKLVLAASAFALVVVGLWGWAREPLAATGIPEARAAIDETRTAPDTAAAGEDAPRVAADARTPVAVAGEPRAALRGRVVELGDGRPIVGARVSVHADTNERETETRANLRELEAALARGERAAESEWRSALAERSFAPPREPAEPAHVTTSDGGGRFSFEALPPGDHVLYAASEEHVTTRISRADRDRLEARELEIRLAPAGSLEVEVVNEAGAPIPDLRVAVTAAPSLDRGTASFELGGREGHGPSDARGLVRADRVPCGVELCVQPWPPGERRGERTTRAVSVTLDLATRRGRARLVLADTGSLTGLVQPAPTDGQRIEARFRPSTTGAAAAVALVGADGSFELEDLPAGRGRFELAMIRLGSRASTSLDVEREVCVRPGARTDLGLLELGASARLAGHVFDWGVSSSDDFVELRFLRESRTLARTVLDDAGRFAAWISPGPCAIEVVHLGRVLGVVLGSAPEDDLALDLSDFCAGLEGRVPDSERELSLLFPLIEEVGAPGSFRRASPRPIHGPLRVRERAFRTLTLAPGRYSLLVPFGARGAAWIPRVELQSGRVTDLGELSVGFGSLRGRVVDEQGEPACGAEVTLSSSMSLAMRTFSDRGATTSDDGTFEVQRLPAGPWLATVRRAGEVAASDIVDVFPGNRAGVELLLRSSARVSVRVTRGGTPVPDAPFTLTRVEGPELFELRTSKEGRADSGELAPGNWTWQLGGTPAQRSGRMMLRPDEHRSLDLDQRDRPVRLRLNGPVAGIEIVEALAWCLDADRRGEMQRSLDEGADWFELDLEPGRYLVAARTFDTPYCAVVELPPDVRELAFHPSELSLTVRVAPDQRDASPPVVSLLALDGLSVEGWGIPTAMMPIAGSEGGWRCNSLPGGAGLRLSGVALGSGALERELYVSDRDVEVDWP